ncbi:Ldh family oxidoreductase [Virgibacillus ndiopensis]|uniref:Ldh family oxidoreductase n=1 Tax=Virgibacillus ndiopensis TaxID=2004408 RepID=UPI000C070AD3|nr:Ldh family oxidoreductase [Virgibacillus ndiopensis]
MSNKRYHSKELFEFCLKIFIHIGFNEEDANVAAESLVRAELEGASSHGINRLVIYVKRIRESRIEAKPNIEFEEYGSILKVNGGNGLGQVVSHHALDKAIPLARKNGIAGVFVRNSNHFGTAAYFCQNACEKGMAMIATTNSPPGIAPSGGREPFLGTNPVAFGFPTKQAPPVIVDMSSSVVARGKIMVAKQKGESIPPIWAIDEEGKETTDPVSALRGALLPLGGPKGYALAMAVEIMSSVLSGAAFGPHVNNLYKDNDPPADVGHCFILLDIEKWTSMESYYSKMNKFLEEIRNVPLAEGSEDILYPGERRYRTYVENKKQGIALSEEVVKELEQLGKFCGISFPVKMI